MTAALDTVLVTEELQLRPQRAPDYRGENELLTFLVESLAESPTLVLEKVAESILKTLGCDTAVISFLVEQPQPRFTWRVVAGAWKEWQGTSFSREFSPCGEVLEQDTPLLFSRLADRYVDFQRLTPVPHEALLVPFHVGHRVAGIIWAVSNPDTREFDAEDLRRLTGMAVFTSAALQTQQSLAASERLAAIVESSDDAIISKDLNGVIQSWNRAAERLFGYSEGEVIGRPITLIIPPERISEEPTVLDRIRRGERIDHYETVRQRKDGTTVPISLSVSPITDQNGKITGASKIVRDITERKKIEETLAQADRRKSEFLAMLSHELRNPLAPIQNALGIIRTSGCDPETLGIATEMMQRQVGQMVRLVDDLLDVSRISRGKISLRHELVDLREVIDQVVEAVRPVCTAMNHELTVTVPPTSVMVLGDRTRLTQAIGNLVNNACKFTERGGQVGLSLRRIREQAQIQVRDNGIGIPPDQLDRVFEVFVQLDTSLGRTRDGLGLGLALAKTLVEMHSGVIKASSAGTGQGSQFTTLLPLHAPGRNQAALDPSTLQLTGRQRRVLVVDDNMDSAESLAMLLRLSGFDVAVANDGLEAVESARTFQPEVILLDLGLPRLDGYGAASRIREENEGGGPLLVAVTGWGQEEDHRRTQEAGFDAHLHKPLDMSVLKQLLK